MYRDYTYIASGSGGGVTMATMGSPTPGSTLAGTTVTFSWASTGASMYWLDVGLTVGNGGIYGANVGTQTSIVVSGIPTGHVPIYVQLWTFIGSTWQVNRYTYTGP